MSMLWTWSWLTQSGGRTRTLLLTTLWSCCQHHFMSLSLSLFVYLILVRLLNYWGVNDYNHWHAIIIRVASAIVIMRIGKIVFTWVSINAINFIMIDRVLGGTASLSQSLYSVALWHSLISHIGLWSIYFGIGPESVFVLVWLYGSLQQSFKIWFIIG